MVILMMIVLLLFLIFQAELCVTGARSGLMLWASQLLPVLLPFCILSKILMLSQAMSILMEKLHLPIWGFVLLCGIFFGFPMGSILAKDFYEAGSLTEKQARSLFLFANHLSPAFVSGYFLSEQLQRPDLLLLSIILLYLPPIIACIAYNLSPMGSNDESPHKKTASRLQINFEIIDAGIMNSLETMLGLGVYLMLFAILINICIHCLPSHCVFRQISVHILEVTNAIHLICKSDVTIQQKYSACMSAIAFGGLCGLAQAASITARYRKVFHLLPYVIVHSTHALLIYFFASLIC